MLLFWLAAGLWLAISVLNSCLLWWWLDMCQGQLHLEDIFFSGLFIVLGPCFWLIVLVYFFCLLCGGLVSEGYEQWILPLRWPGILRRHDACLAAMPDGTLLRKLRGWPIFEIGVSGGPIGGGCYQKMINVTCWYGAKLNAQPHEAVAVYMLRWQHHVDALNVRTDLWQIRHQLQPVALIVWCCTGEPLPLMRQAIADLTDAIIVQSDRNLDLRVWSDKHRPELKPLLAHSIKL